MMHEATICYAFLVSKTFHTALYDKSVNSSSSFFCPNDGDICKGAFEIHFAPFNK
jgi:hypothetical protein